MAGTSLPAVRADVCGPTEPTGWRDLAERLPERQSVERALKRLTRPCLRVAEAAATLGYGVTKARIMTLLGGPGFAVGDALTTLERHALVWPGHGEARRCTLPKRLAEALQERWPRAGPSARPLPGAMQQHNVHATSIADLPSPRRSFASGEACQAAR